jgi:hypothetical protein
MDDKDGAPTAVQFLTRVILSGVQLPYACHPERSAAESKDLQLVRGKGAELQ